jgi:hypothetical protein
MKKDSFNSILRSFVKNNISPTESERAFVSSIYDSIKSTLDNSCIQVGSYPRFTATRPLHDLDVLYIIGNWEENNHNASETLKLLYSKIQREYQNPTKLTLVLSLQSHSINLSYKDSEKEIFSVDIVPAYIISKNEFNDDIYMVPEVIRKKHGKPRNEYYQRLLTESAEMDWIISDPRGYIEIAKRVNQSNKDFRRTVKFIKAWKYYCKEKNNEFGLKSFHIEQVVTEYYQNNNSMEIYDAIFKFFVNIPEIISSPRIKDRANNNRYIDEYLSDLTKGQKEKIIEARDCFLIKLEYFSEEDTVSKLIEGCFYNRVSYSEQFLFDFNIPVLIDPQYSFQISGYVLPREGGFLPYFLDKIGLIKIDRKIQFRIKGTQPNVDLFKWKVRNDSSTEEPRGEITDHQTKNDPERSKYKGNHYVECYAILNGICVGRARQNVKLESVY